MSKPVPLSVTLTSNPTRLSKRVPVKLNITLSRKVVETCYYKCNTNPTRLSKRVPVINITLSRKVVETCWAPRASLVASPFSLRGGWEKPKTFTPESGAKLDWSALRM